MKKFEFGQKVKSLLNGKEGILVARQIHITGCDTLSIQPTEGEEFQVYDNLVSIIDDGIIVELTENGSEFNSFNDIENALYDFGLECKDSLTGFTGKIMQKNIGISGDIAYALTPRHDSKAKDNNACWYDEGRIEVIEEVKKAEVKNTSKRTGGLVPKIKCR